MVLIHNGGSVIAPIEVHFVCAPWVMITCSTIRRYVRQSECAAIQKSINEARYIYDASQAIVRPLSNLQLQLWDWQGMAITQIDCRQDMVIVAPTGGGKSMVFQGLASKDDQNIVFVIPPINCNVQGRA